MFCFVFLYGALLIREVFCLFQFRPHLSHMSASDESMSVSEGVRMPKQMSYNTEQHVSVSFLYINESGFGFFFFLQTLCTVRIGLLWRTDDPFENEVEFLPFWLFDFEDFSSCPLGQNQSFGESKNRRSWVLVWSCPVLVFSCPSSPFYTLASCWGGAGSVQYNGPGPPPPPAARGWAGTLPCLLVLKALDRTLTPQACRPQPQVGWWGHLTKDLHFPQNQQVGGSHSLPEAQAPASVQTSLAWPLRCWPSQSNALLVLY